MFDIIEPEWTCLLSQSVASLTFSLDMLTTQPMQIWNVTGLRQYGVASGQHGFQGKIWDEGKW